MEEDWIKICGFLEDRTSKKGHGSTHYGDRTYVQDKGGHSGSILFKDSSLEIQDNNSPKRTYQVNIHMGYVP